MPHQIYEINLTLPNYFHDNLSIVDNFFSFATFSGTLTLCHVDNFVDNSRYSQEHRTECHVVYASGHSLSGILLARGVGVWVSRRCVMYSRVSGVKERMDICLSLSSIPLRIRFSSLFLHCVMEWEKVGGSGRYDRESGIKWVAWSNCGSGLARAN
jgi:hypothetical protein